MKDDDAAQLRKEAAPATRKLDERVRKSRETVLRTTCDILAARGMSGVSVDEVSKLSGVAKTTIYRQWRTGSALVLEACALISTAQTTPDTGTLLGDANALVMELARMLREERWPSVLPSLVDAAERDADLARITGAIQIDHTAPYLAVLKRAQVRGELPADADLPAIVAQLVGPVFYRRWFSRESIDARFVKRVVSAALSGAVVRAGRAL
ncbi:TetR/AcrR family transcriptional regulator [Roseateles chitinivorans]|uniref:TetR/AcrR family transcriptional regulator n=1 Tax=Roseateles chitinivorans TaxID=2917965 RepID=UPI003D66B480